MKFNTTRFGEIDIADNTLIHLAEGILGFPTETQYVMLEHDSEGTPFKWLQSTENPDLAFVVIDPYEILPDYAFEVDDEHQEKLELNTADDLIPMVILNIPHDNPGAMTANLRAPVIVNASSRQGAQIVLKEDYYAFNYRLFPDMPADEAEKESSVF